MAQSDVRVMVDTGSAYELLLSAVTIADPASRRTNDAGDRWFKEAEAIGRDKAVDPIRAIGREPFINLLGYAYQSTEDASAASLIDALAHADPREVVLALVGHYRRAVRMCTPPDTIRAAVDGDRAATREFRRTNFPDLRHWQRSLRFLLGTGHEKVRSTLVSGLTVWYEGGILPIEDDIVDVQGRDAERVRRLLVTGDLDTVLEQVAPGMTFTRAIGQSTVVLVPDLMIRPGWALSDYGPTMVISFPATADRDDPDIPPPRLITLAKALGDPVRLRALREVHRRGPITPSELAEVLGVPRTSLQYHVRVLLVSGLLTLSVDDARWGRLELRDLALEEIGRMAEDYITGP